MSCDGTGDQGLRLVLAPGPGPVLTVPEQAPGPVPEQVPGPAGTGGTLVLAEPVPGSRAAPGAQLLTFLKREGKRAWATARRKSALADMARHLWTAQPESTAHHRAHVKAAAWVPVGYENVRWLKWARRIWVAEHLSVGRSFVVLGNSISAMGARTRRRVLAAACLALTVILFIAFA
jgi:hypothetical protein